MSKLGIVFTLNNRRHYLIHLSFCERFGCFDTYRDTSKSRGFQFCSKEAIIQIERSTESPPNIALSSTYITTSQSVVLLKLFVDNGGIFFSHSGICSALERAPGGVVVILRCSCVWFCKMFFFTTWAMFMLSVCLSCCTCSGTKERFFCST